MNLNGIGTLCCRGRGVAAFEQALREGWRLPSSVQVPFQTAPFPAYTIGAEALTDKTYLQAIRRADRFTKMAVLAGADALADAAVPDLDRTRVGVIVTTAFGPHVTTFRFLDDILTYGDAGVSPTIFSHTVHNAAASYLAMALGLRGPTLTVTLFSFPVHEALRLADAWLRERRCDHVLVGAVDECGAAMEYIVREKLSVAGDGVIRPFRFAPAPCTVPGEGCVFMLLSQSDGPAYARIDADVTSRPASSPAEADLVVLDADGMLPDETAYRECVRPGVPATAIAPLVGGLMTGSAFSAAAAAIMLRRQETFASPTDDNPFGVRLCAAEGHSVLRRVICLKRDCQKHWGIITLSPP